MTYYLISTKDMKNILILSFIHNDPIYIRRFELLRDHYNKIISYFALPIKYYGVLVTDNDTHIDEDNNMIYIRDLYDEYDKRLVYKVRDTYQYLHDMDFPYDVTVKSNASFLINLVFLNRTIQEGDLESVLCPQILKTYNIPWNLTARGNMLVIPHKIMTGIVSAMTDEYIEKIHNTSNLEISYCSDDIYISSILCNMGCYIYEIPQKFTRHADAVSGNVIIDPFEILHISGITIKSFYNAGDKIYYDNPACSDDEVYAEYINHMDTDDIDLIQMRWFISILEHEYIR